MSMFTREYRIATDFLRQKLLIVLMEDEVLAVLWKISSCTAKE